MHRPTATPVHSFIFVLRSELKIAAGILFLVMLFSGCQRNANSPTSRPANATDKLSDAVIKGNESEVRKLLAAGVDVNGGDKSDETPLQFAAILGRLKIATLLLDHGAKVDARHDSGHTALTDAISGDHIDVVKLLLERGASVEIGGPFKPIQEAGSDGNPEIVALILAHGAKPNGFNYGAPLSMAADSTFPKRSEAVRLLVAAGADLNHRDPQGNTAMTIAAMAEHWDVVTLLAELGADVNVADPIEKRTPLHQAALHNKADVIRILLAHGANSYAVNWQKRTPLDFALRAANPDSPAKTETVQLLKDAMQKAASASQPASK